MLYQKIECPTCKGKLVTYRSDFDGFYADPPARNRPGYYSKCDTCFGTGFTYSEVSCATCQCYQNIYECGKAYYNTACDDWQEREENA